MNMYQNWTDDLPICSLCDIGTESKVCYKIEKSFTSEDRSFRLACPNNEFLYGIFDGHDGGRVATFAQQKLPAELILGQLKDEYDEVKVKEILNEAFESVAKEFVDCLITNALMEKVKLMELLPKNISKVELQQRYFSLYNQLEACNRAIAGGCSAVVALIHQRRLFIANVGDARAILCRQDEATGELGIVQLSVDHTPSTETELQRLLQLGLEEKLEELQTSDIIKRTRSIGDWILKNEYKDIDLLKDACEEPIISTPSIHGGELLHSSMKFLFLMSHGLYQSYKEATGISSKQVNNEIAHLIAEELYRTGAVRGVAQYVVHQICCLHKDNYMKTGRHPTRSDMTLLVRVFNEDEQTKVVEKPKKSPEIKKKMPNLTPIVIPKPQIGTPPPSTTSTPNSTGSNTPTTVTPGTPGSAGNLSPLNNPFSRIHLNQLPLTVYSEGNELNSNIFVTNIAGDNEGVKLENVPSDGNIEPLRVDTSAPILNLQEFPSERNIEPLRVDTNLQNTPLEGNLEPLRINSSAITNLPPSESHMEPLRIDTTGIMNYQLAGPELSLVETTEHFDSTETSSSTTSKNSSIQDKTLLFNRPAEPLEIDEDGRIKPYVDFTEFFEKVNEMGGERVVFSEFL